MRTVAEVRLSEIQNLIIDPEKKTINRAIPEFIASLLGEYAMGVLRYDEDDGKVFSYIRKFFSTDEMSSTEMIRKLAQDDEIRALYKQFPDIGKQASYDHNEWQLFLDEATWIETADQHIITLSGRKYEIPKLLLALEYEGNQYYVKRYHQEGRTAIYKNIGTDDMEMIVEKPLLFDEIVSSRANDSSTKELLRLSSEEFFLSSKTLKSADQEQREAITSDIYDNLVVLAGAGSGKTRTLCCRLAYLHLVQGIPLSRILLLTFTNPAAETMRQQSKELMEPIYTRYAPTEKPVINARTIDSFAIRLVDSQYALMGFSEKPVKNLDTGGEKEAAKQKMIGDIIRENNLGGVFGDYIKRKDGKGIGRLTKDLLDYAAGVPISHAGFDTLLGLYMDEQRHQNKVMGFVEASLFVKEAMEQPQSGLADHLKKTYSCILIDEFQDINVLQNSIFQPLYRSEIHFTFVGDDDQAIYYWRGSDSEIVKNLISDSNVKTVYLLTNYRNNPNIVKAGNAVLRTIPDRAKKGREIMPSKMSGDKIIVTTYDSKYTNLVNEVSRVMKVQPSEEICILARERQNVNDICEALGAADIPYIAKRNRINTATDSYRLMKAILSILNESNVSASAKEIRRIFQCPDITERKIRQVVTGKCPVADCEKELFPVRSISDELLQSSPVDLAGAVYLYSVKIAELFERIANDRSSDPMYSAFEEFCRNNGAPWPTPKKQLDGLFRVFESEFQGGSSGSKKALSNGVRVSTFHASKGLEYNVIFITGLSSEEYVQANRIEQTYITRKYQLQTLQEAREEYYKLRETVTEATIQGLIDSCSNPAFSKEERTSIERFEDTVGKIKNKLLNLTADGVDEFLLAFSTEIQPLEQQYRSDCEELRRRLLAEKTRVEEIEETLLLNAENLDSQPLSEEMNEKKDKILSIERDLNRNRNRELRFSNSIDEIKRFYNICFAASGFLADMAKEEDMEELLSQAEKEKKKRLDEEWRLYYVAITRARDHLYLCYREGTTQSEFIKVIDDDTKQNYTMLTYEEEQEYQRLSRALHKEMEQLPEGGEHDDSVEESKAKEYSDALLSIKGFERHIKENKEIYEARYPAFQDLSAKAKEYYDRAIGLLSVSEMLKENFSTEIAHNLQTMAKVVLSQYAGNRALPYKTEDENTARKICHDIQTASQNCKTNPPGRKWLYDLLMKEDKFSNELKELKSLAINHYILRSGKYAVPSELSRTWLYKDKLNNPYEFLIAALDLANIRNTLIHNLEERSEGIWAEDIIPQILGNAEKIVSMSHVDPRLLHANDIISGVRVRHTKFGYGYIKTVTSDRFSIVFDDSGLEEKTFTVPHTVSEAIYFLG